MLDELYVEFFLHKPFVGFYFSYGSDNTGPQIDFCQIKKFTDFISSVSIIFHLFMRSS